MSTTQKKPLENGDCQCKGTISCNSLPHCPIEAGSLQQVEKEKERYV